jgi:hypothetical protein
VEYVLVASLIALAAVAGMAMVANGIIGAFDHNTTTFRLALDQSGSGGSSSQPGGGGGSGGGRWRATRKQRRRRR